MPSTQLEITALYQEHGAFIARTIERLTGYGTHVDDLLQETFIVAHQKQHQFDPNLASPATWLYGIAVNKSRHYLRSRRRFSLLQARFLQDSDNRPAPGADAQLEQHQNSKLVHEVLRELPFKQREIFVCYELENLDGDTIATLVGIPQGTVWTRLHHARKHFTKLMRRKLAREEAR